MLNMLSYRVFAPLILSRRWEHPTHYHIFLNVLPSCCTGHYVNYTHLTQNPSSKPYYRPAFLVVCYVILISCKVCYDSCMVRHNYFMLIFLLLRSDILLSCIICRPMWMNDNKHDLLTSLQTYNFLAL